MPTRDGWRGAMMKNWYGERFLRKKRSKGWITLRKSVQGFFHIKFHKGMGHGLSRPWPDLL
jgi:hypothetical protein